MNFEQEKRRQNVNYAIASCELEGCIIPKEFHELAEEYIKGKISLKEFGENVRKDLQ